MGREMFVSKGEKTLQEEKRSRRIFNNINMRCVITSNFLDGEMEANTNTKKEMEESEGNKKEERQPSLVVMKDTQNMVSVEKNIHREEERPSEKMVDVDKDVSEIEKTEKTGEEEEGTWETVSPTKIGRPVEQRNATVVSIASPSKFSVLAEEEEEEVEEGEKVEEEEQGKGDRKSEEEEKEEGEIAEKPMDLVTENAEKRREEGGVRPSIPRASKSAHKLVSNAQIKKAQDNIPTAKSTKGRNRNSH